MASVALRLAALCRTALVAPAASAVPVRPLVAAWRGLSTEAAATPSYTIEEVETAPAAAPRTRQAWYSQRAVPGHTKKLLLLSRQVRGLSVNEAVAQMTFSPKRRSKILRHAIERAATKADFYHELTADELMIDQVSSGKGPAFPRVRHHARGRAGMSHFRYSSLRVVLREMTAEEKKALNKFSKATPVALEQRKNARFY